MISGVMEMYHTDTDTIDDPEYFNQYHSLPLREKEENNT